MATQATHNALARGVRRYELESGEPINTAPERLIAILAEELDKLPAPPTPRRRCRTAGADGGARVLARSGDPSTSQAAAAATLATVSEVQEWAASCVRKMPGKTQRELAARYCKDDPRKIGRRLSECERLCLVRRGEARKCRVSGRMAETWWPAKPTTLFE